MARALLAEALLAEAEIKNTPEGLSVGHIMKF